jgi:LmeA-like phospholipid-binding
VAGRAGRRLLVVVVVLAALLAAADRIGVYVAERIAGTTLQSSQHLAHRPDVDIAGFPFLNQFAAGDYDKITVTAQDVPVGQQAHPLNLSRLRVVLHELTVSRDFTDFHSKTATATGTIGYADLGRTLGVDLGYAGNGRVRASKQITIAGITVRGAITSKPALTGTALSFANATVEGAGNLAAAVIDALQQIFAIRIPLARIPFDIHVTSLAAGPQGIVISLTGHDLSYSR